MSTPSIAICTTGELFGGVERHVLGLCEELVKQGADTLLILFHNKELAEQARDKGLNVAIFSDSNLSLYENSKKLAIILKHNNIGVIHVHGYKATVLCALSKRLLKFSLVKTVHGVPESKAAGLLLTLRNSIYCMLDDTATRYAASAVCYVSNDLRKRYEQTHVGLYRTVIPNGVPCLDRTQFPCPHEVNPTMFNVVMAGRLDIVKGHHLALEAISKHDLPQDIHIYILGSGPRERELRVMAEKYGISSRVHFLGFRRNILDFIAHADLLLMPSLHEGLPYTLLESMALGTPVIASAVGGLKEVLSHEITGLLIPANDVNSLVDAILRLYKDRTLRMRLGVESQRLQRLSYTVEAMAQQYSLVYSKLTSPHNHDLV
jgi:glycosyltransferase involved in cell wall biosynthesis